MAQQDDPYGLTLMDVLINTLLLAMVLMMIAAAFIEPIKVENVPDPGAGSNTEPTELEFKTVPDPVTSGCDLNLTFQLIDGNPANIRIWIKMKSGNIAKDSVQVLSGVYDQQFWHITRNCLPELNRYGEWEVMLTAENVGDLPSSILLHGVRGIRPIRFATRSITPDRQLVQSLLTISGDNDLINGMPKIIIQ